MTPEKITWEDLEDGKKLEAAVAVFNLDRTKENLFTVLQILRDSYVWVPCTAVFSDADKERLNKIAENLVNNPDADPTELIGKTFTSEGVTRLVPDILKNGEKYFFPIFSTVEAMGEYGNDFSKVQKHMLEVIMLARNNEKDLSGIVLNAFSDPFILSRELWDYVEKMNSRISEE